jgi:hypothetical protein
MEKSNNLTIGEVQQGCSSTAGDSGRTQYDLYYMALYSNMDKKINSDILNLQFN